MLETHEICFYTLCVNLITITHITLRLNACIYSVQACVDHWLGGFLNVVPPRHNPPFFMNLLSIDALFRAQLGELLILSCGVKSGVMKNFLISSECFPVLRLVYDGCLLFVFHFQHQLPRSFCFLPSLDAIVTSTVTPGIL